MRFVLNDWVKRCAAKSVRPTCSRAEQGSRVGRPGGQVPKRRYQAFRGSSASSRAADLLRNDHRTSLPQPRYVPTLSQHWVPARPAQSRSVAIPRTGYLDDQQIRDPARLIRTERDSGDLSDNAEVAGSIPASPTRPTHHVAISRRTSRGKPVGPRRSRGPGQVAWTWP
jgi:hypothetical protein